MKKKDRENEYIGIISIILIVILAILLLYYYYPHHPSVSNGTNSTHIPIEAPSPPIDKTESPSSGTAPN
jgi:uncharacterized protein YpmB